MYKTDDILYIEFDETIVIVKVDWMSDTTLYTEDIFVIKGTPSIDPDLRRGFNIKNDISNIKKITKEDNPEYFL